MEWTPNQVVAYNLRRIREDKGITQEEACHATAPYLPGGGWSRAVWSAAERSVVGRRIRIFDADVVTALAAGLDVPILSFFLPPSPCEEPLDTVRAVGAIRGMSVAEALERAVNNNATTTDRIGEIASDLGVQVGEGTTAGLQQMAVARDIRIAFDHIQKALDSVGGNTPTESPLG